VPGAVRNGVPGVFVAWPKKGLMHQHSFWSEPEVTTWDRLPYSLVREVLEAA